MAYDYDDRQTYTGHHHYLIGSPGTGKTTLLKTWAIEDILDGKGLLFIDLFGHAVNDIMQYIPQERIADTTLLDLSHHRSPSLHLFDHIPKAHHPLVASNTLSFMTGVARFSERDSTPNFDMFILHGIRALLDMKNATFADLIRFLTDSEYRDAVLEACDDPFISNIWRNYILSLKDVSDKMNSVVNKLSVVLLDPRLRKLTGSPKSTVDLADVRKRQGVVLVRAPISKLGRVGAELGARYILTVFAQTAMRNNVPFSCYIDAFQLLQGQTLNELLAFGREHGISCYLSHQFLGQLETDNQAAVLGNCGVKVAARVSITDAEVLKGYFPGDNINFDLQMLQQFRARVQLPDRSLPEKLDITRPNFEHYGQSPKALKARINGYERLGQE